MFPCKSCTERFENVNKLYRHHVIKHARTFMCDVCDKTFADYLKLINHILKHIPEEQLKYGCSLCCKRFSTIKNLQKHLKLFTTARKHFVRYCDQRYSRRLLLKEHMRVEHKFIPPQQKPKQEFVCKMCSERFNLKARRYIHYVKNYTYTRFPCKHCNNNFFEENKLTAHLSMHLPEDQRPYACTACPRHFVTNIQMQVSHLCRSQKSEKISFVTSVRNSFLRIACWRSI